MRERKIHSFGRTDPDSECYGTSDHRQPTCGILIERKFVTNKPKDVTCKRCLKLESARRW